jgi:hypothetical protein
MPYKATLSDGLVHVQWLGVLEAGDLLQLTRDLAKFGATLGYAPNVLHTFSRMKRATIEPWSMLQHAFRRRDTQLPNPVRIAWVATTAEVRRMGELFVELNRNPKIEIAVFGTRAAARAWLRATPEAPVRANGAAAG